MAGVNDAGELYVFGPFQLDPSRRRLRRAAAELTLPPTALDVLIYLVANPGRVVTKEELLKAVWAGRTVDESSVKQAIFALRRGLGEEGERLILTASGRGYRFAEIPRRLEDAEPQAEPPVRSRRGMWTLVALGVVAVVGLGAAAAWRMLAPPPVGRSVVVADFENRTGEKVFDGALTSLLRADLGQSPFLSLVPDRQARQTLVQMTKPADAVITPALADEVCIRKNADTVVAGSIAAIGAQYLVTLTATDCSGDHLLAAEKAEVAGRDAILPAIDGLIARVRSKVGESRRSIDQFNVPMMDVRTGSLDALKSYSQATWLSSHGRLSDALPLFQHAADLDPNFAAAYFGIGVLEITIHNKDLGAAALQKAFDLRDTVNERLKLQITATYSQYVTRDLTAALQNYRSWVSLYPKDASAWSDLADAELSLGDNAQAAKTGDQALALKPTFEAGYVVPARAYLALNQFEKAQAVARETIKIGLGGDSTHDALMRAAFALGDDAGVERERAWSATAPSPRTTFGAGDIELSRGRVKAAEGFLDRYGVLMGGREAEDAGRSDRARGLADMGLRQEALALLQPEPKSFQPDAAYTIAEIGDRSRAEAMLAAELEAHPSDTLLTKVFAPQTRAALALRDGKPLQAVAELQPALPYRARNFRTDYLLGQALLAAGDGVRAAAAFQTILDHRGWDPEAVDYPLAKLGLARAQHLTHKDAASLASYRSFLADWRGADANVPALIAAKAEYRQLSAGHPG